MYTPKIAYFIQILGNRLLKHQGHTCCVVHRTKLLIRQYILPQKTDHAEVVLVTYDLDGPSDQNGLFTQVIK